MFIIIAAIGKNRELGYQNQLIWPVKEDLKFFKEQTWDHQILMGRNTYYSLPAKLPHRTYLVLSSKKDYPEDVRVFASLEEVLEYAKEVTEDIYVIGGAQVYQTLLPYTEKMYLTEIDETTKKADAFFPEFSKEDWDQTLLLENQTEEIHYKRYQYTLKKR